MAGELQDYYATLSVSLEASDAKFKNAFRTMARKYRPDVALPNAFIRF